jgi:alpha-amylase
MKLLGVCLGMLFAVAAQAGNEPRTVFVQLFEWPWKAVAEECERYLGPNGFSAVQVSPPTEHLNTGKHQWWERYQPISYKLETRGGSEAEFAEMVRRCKSVGVEVYSDVVLNHMSAEEEGVGFAGSSHKHYDYPYHYQWQDFHHCGRNAGEHQDDIINYHDLYELQNCELLNLADLNTSSPYVQDKLAGLLRKLLDLGVGGFRIDASKHMNSEDIKGIFSRVGRPFYALHELITGPGEPVPVGPYTETGDVNVFPYAYGIGMAVRGEDLTSLLQLPSKFGVNSDDAITFLENHDLERRPKEEPLVPFVGDQAAHRLGLVFLLTYPYGYPQLYSGFKFDGNYDMGPPVNERGYTNSPIGGDGNCVAPWTCAHRMPGVKELVRFRNKTASEFRASDVLQPEASMLSFGRGSLGHVLMNAAHQQKTFRVQTRMAPGNYCNLLESRHCAQVREDGQIEVTLPPRSAFVIQDRQG